MLPPITGEDLAILEKMRNRLGDGVELDEEELRKFVLAQYLGLLKNAASENTRRDCLQKILKYGRVKTGWEEAREAQRQGVEYSQDMKKILDAEREREIGSAQEQALEAARKAAGL